MPELPALPEIEAQAAGQMRPTDFARHALATIEASEGRRKRRKRNTTPDALGLEMKREILEGITAADPPPEDLEGHLLSLIHRSDFPGPLRALCGEVLDEYRLALISGQFRDWLESGAPSEDREQRPEGCGPGCEIHDRHRSQGHRDRADG